MKNTFKLAVLGCTALSMAYSQGAYAFTLGTATIEDPTPAGITDAAAQAVCTAKATAHGGVAPYVWHGTLEPGSIDGSITSGPTADGVPFNIINVQGTGTPIPDSVVVAGNPFRNGGSVNMFGLAHVVSAHYPNSEHDFTQHFIWQSTYTFTCNMTQTVLIPATGHHAWNHEPSDAEDQRQNACDAHDAAGQFIGVNVGHCYWVVDNPAHNETQDRPDEYGSIGPVNEGGNLDGHETNGGPVPVDPNAVQVPDVQVVVCISPSSTGKKLPGAWVAKNGYNGGSFTGPGAGCNTTWFNTGATAGVSNLNTTGNALNVTVPYP